MRVIVSDKASWNWGTTEFLLWLSSAQLPRKVLQQLPLKHTERWRKCCDDNVNLLFYFCYKKRGKRRSENFFFCLFFCKIANCCKCVSCISGKISYIMPFYSVIWEVFFYYLHIFRKVLTFLYLFGICIYANQHVASQNEQHFTVENGKGRNSIKSSFFFVAVCFGVYTWVNGPAGDTLFWQVIITMLESCNSSMALITDIEAQSDFPPLLLILCQCVGPTGLFRLDYRVNELYSK